MAKECMMIVTSFVLKKNNINCNKLEMDYLVFYFLKGVGM